MFIFGHGSANSLHKARHLEPRLRRRAFLSAGVAVRDLVLALLH